LGRKSEIEARYFWLQRVQEDPARFGILLVIYARWVAKIDTPRGLADFVTVGDKDEKVEKIEEVKLVDELVVNQVPENINERYVSENK
jgi:hypothetical protein